MRHRVSSPSQLGRKPDHRGLLLRNLATSIILHGKVQTTAARARSVQPLVDHVIAMVKSKTEPREAIRYLKSVLLDERAQKKVLSELTKRYEKRTSGFTRITPLGLRAGDAALRVQIELV
jgi:large subunit ribosomal protein L17